MLRADKLQRLRERRIPIEKRAFAANEAFSQGITNKDYEYLVSSMQPISVEYTENTFREATRIEDQLKAGLPHRFLAEFDYQGSVTSDTHIRVHSDIDLLVMHGGFVSLDEGASNASPYKGNSMQDLLDLRTESASLLKIKFPAATVDSKPGKAISVSGGSLNRKVDVVVGNWWDTQLYKTYGVKMARGINIVDSKVPKQIKNKPFWHNYEIDKKDEKTKGLRKVIRLLKTLKYDADPELTISSYDIASIAFNMSNESLTVDPGSYLKLARNAKRELEHFINNQTVRDSLAVPNGTRKVFCAEGANLAQLRALHGELSELLAAIDRSTDSYLILLHEMYETPSYRAWNEIRPEIVRKHSY